MDEKKKKKKKGKKNCNHRDGVAQPERQMTARERAEDDEIIVVLFRAPSFIRVYIMYTIKTTV